MAEYAFVGGKRVFSLQGDRVQSVSPAGVIKNVLVSSPVAFKAAQGVFADLTAAAVQFNDLLAKLKASGSMVPDGGDPGIPANAVISAGELVYSQGQLVVSGV